MTVPLTPSNQHSDEAKAAYPEVSEGWNVVIEQTQEDRIDDLRTAFDRGRTSAPVSTITVTDRERLIDIIAHALRPDAFWNETALYPTRTREDWEAEQAVATIEAEPIADAILADPTVPLVSTREAIARHFHSQREASKAFTWDNAPQWAKDNAYRDADALFAANLLVDRGESDAQAQRIVADQFDDLLFKFGTGEFSHAEMVEQQMNLVSRLRSGKAEA